MPRWKRFFALRPAVFWGVGLFCAASGFSVSKARAADVSVFAAASLQEVVETVAQAFEAQSDYDVTVSFAGSSALARQIEYGAPADVFVSANVAWVDHLAARGLIDDSLRSVDYGNRLALVAPSGTEAVFARGISDGSALAEGSVGADRVAMALVEAVPAGIYGRQAFETLGLWEALVPHVAQVDNVRAALALVALGEAQAGVVYVTDARADPRVQIVAEFAEDTHDPIVYPATVVTGQDRPEVLEFMTFWRSEAAREIFAAQGFGVLDGS